jgi:hypothetical protein
MDKKLVRKKPIRRSQLVSPFGVGAIVDFRGPEALMTAGLDVWPKAKKALEECSEFLILEERLQARLNKSHFRLPPHFEDDRYDVDQLIPFVRFPRWHYCSDCCLMREMDLYEHRARCCSERCLKRPERYRSWLMPVRIIAVCENGHVDDFPFYEWVHGNRPQNIDTHELFWRATGTSSSLAGITIACSCSRSRTLQGAFSFSSQDGGALKQELDMDCGGKRPWLGELEGTSSCSQHLRVVQRGATNVYFPIIKSSIYLPSSVDDQDDWLLKIVEKCIRKAADRGGDGALEKAVEACAWHDNIDPPSILMAAVRQKIARDQARSGTAVLSDEEFRLEEYQVLRGRELNPGKELRLKEYSMPDYEEMQQFFSKIRLVTKLRETRVLESFTRISPVENGTSTPQAMALDPNIDWLPAIIVRGEGIFFEFNDERLNAWEPGVIQRAINFRNRYETSVRRQDRIAIRLSARFVLLHTFAHLMIRELTYECGYGTAALRERIYCDIEGSRMNGVLIYTASGDSEGTLGGLVRQAHPTRLLRCFKEALNKAMWCSGDPVCIESPGQGTNNSNQAACHGCALLPETCCEQGNMLLDRAFLIGKTADRKLGYFHP